MRWAIDTEGTWGSGHRHRFQRGRMCVLSLMPKTVTQLAWGRATVILHTVPLRRYYVDASAVSRVFPFAPFSFLYNGIVTPEADVSVYC